TTSQSGIEITLFDDAGTYLRATPEILDTNTLVLIPASTGGLTLIGKIYGDTPSDGSSNLWYFVEYSTGPTTTHTGYVYSERCNLSKPLTDLVLDTDLPETSTSPDTNQALSDTSTTSNPDKTLDANLTTTPTLMWIVAIIFIIPIIIVFIMLVKRPRRLADDYDLIANNNGDNINFEFDEAYAPTIKKSNSRTFPKFKTTKLDELSRFIKLDTTIETAKPLDPTESMTNFNELPNQNPNNLKTTINPKIATNIPRKPIKFAKNIRFSPKSLCNSPKTPSYPPKNPSYPPRTLENSIDFANYLQDNDNYLTKNSTFTPEFDVNLPKALENSSFPQVVDDFTPTSTKNHQSSAKNPEEYPINNQKYTLSADNSTFSPEKYTKKPKKYTHFFSSILNRKQKNQKINKNRKRDEFRPSVLSSDDYFEFADSFELTTPMNSHLVFNSKKPPATIRSGKKINKH
ncbi:MAG: hypothetical protein J6J23_07365, partial [Clostridia bacterium]|nr:hypothetical protein [Clostridia bacterium]